MARIAAALLAGDIRRLGDEVPLVSGRPARSYFALMSLAFPEVLRILANSAA